jgi:phenylalanyl-tRNA synthetase alpha chain
MEDQLATLLSEAKSAISDAESPAVIEQLRINLFGKKGQLTDLLKQVSQAPVDIRPELGRLVNQAKQDLMTCLQQREQDIQAQYLADRLQQETIDITLPGRHSAIGSFHPVSRVRMRVEEIFIAAGFSIAEGPEIEDEDHNFDALNILPSHPARDSVLILHLCKLE